MGIQRFQGLQALHHKVIEDLAGGDLGAGQGEDVVLHPIAQDTHLVGQAQGARLAGTGAGERGGQGTALAVVLGRLHLLLQRIAAGDGGIGAPFQGGAQAGQFLQAVKDIPAWFNLG